MKRHIFNSITTLKITKSVEFGIEDPKRIQKGERFAETVHKLFVIVQMSHQDEKSPIRPNSGSSNVNITAVRGNIIIYNLKD